jgi:Replication-relaxation
VTVLTPLKYCPTETDIEIFAAVNVLGFATAAQLARILYNGEDRLHYARARLRRLEAAGYLAKFSELPRPRFGSSPAVFTLANPGRRTLSTLGIELTTAYTRPVEEREKAGNLPHMLHTLQIGDVLSAALRLEREEDVVLERVLNERQLKRLAPRVTLRSGHVTSVIPDCFLTLTPKGGLPVGITFEIDRGTEHQKRWRGKVQALAALALGPYQQAFDLDNLTIAVVGPSPYRVSQLADWTRRELESASYQELSEIFLFTSVSPVNVPPQAWFFESMWLHLRTDKTISLLDEHPGELVYRPVEQAVLPETSYLPTMWQSPVPARRSPV